MLAQNKAEEAARHEQTTMASVMSVLSRHPDVSAATNVGEPTLQDKELVNAKDLVAAANRAAVGGAANNVTAGIVKGAPTENQRAPRSHDPAAPATVSEATTASDSQPDLNELKPTADSKASNPAQPADSDELKPNVPQVAKPADAPAMVNEIPLDGGKNGGGTSASSSQSSNQDLASDEMISSSKHKKKKGLQKIIPGK